MPPSGQPASAARAIGAASIRLAAAARVARRLISGCSMLGAAPLALGGFRPTTRRRSFDDASAEATKGALPGGEIVKRGREARRPVHLVQQLDKRTAAEARPAWCSRVPGIAAPLQRDCIKLARSVIARSPCDEAIHAARAMDCR